MERFLQCLILLIAGSMTAGFAESGSAGQPPSCPTCNQYLYWTGEENNDFFDERNWRQALQLPSRPTVPRSPGDLKRKPGQVKPACLPGANKKTYQICLGKRSTHDSHPVAGTLEPGQPIVYNLYAAGSQIEANGAVLFDSPDKGLTLVNAELNVSGVIESGVISLDSGATVHLRNESLPGTSVTLNLLDAESWVYFHQDNPDELLTSGIPALWVQDDEGIPDSTIRINQYYQTGAIVRMKSPDYTPLKIFSGTDFGQDSTTLQASTIYKGNSISVGMNNAVRSFRLKRGYMATFAINENGTGKSKVYIASEEDLHVGQLPLALEGNISFIRVLPWNWVTKKGTGGFEDRLTAGWYYNWGNGETSRPNYAYVPMAWGAGATSEANLNQIIAKEKVTHLLGFNESDNCNGQSGQYNNLCQPEVAVAYFEHLMKTGLRLGSPAPRENGPNTWLKDFQRIAKERDVRFDFVAVHWYDWGSNPQNSPNANPQQVFTRFKNYLNSVYAMYQLPIWITEFNANPNRENSVNAAFLELALPWLEQTHFVERYAYFEPNPDNSSNDVTPSLYFDENGNITNIGEIYRDHVSTPSIPEATYAAPNSLEGLDVPIVEIPETVLAFEAECALYPGNKWQVKTDSSASNLHYMQADPGAPGASAIADIIHFEFETTEAKTFRLWIRAASPANVNGSFNIKVDDKEFETLRGFNTNDFTWFQIPRYYDLSAGRHRVTVAYANAGSKLDGIALVNSSAFNEPATDDTGGACALPVTKWGLAQSDIIYWNEAETPHTMGSQWVEGLNENASGGKYIQPQPSLSSPDSPPGTDGQVSFVFNIQQDDAYELWGKVQTLTHTSDAFWFSVDNEPFRKWDGLQSDVFQWHWKKFHFSEGTKTRDFIYYLSAGHHTVTIAYSEDGAKLDKIAIASVGKDPALEDPNVLLPDPAMVFEAEDAEIIGGATVAACASSSGGEQVKLGASIHNGVRFNNVVGQSAGTYRLSITYMSAATRNFRLFVNDTDLGVISVDPSGAWCFESGSPADTEQLITLEAGVNTITLRPVGTEAPFIDKISLVREAFSMEAEHAELIGTASVVSCTHVSNGAVVNPRNLWANGIKFNNVNVTTAGTYILEMAYVTKNARSARLFVNGVHHETITFPSSDGWCFEDGVPATLSVDITLQQGSNTVEFKPNGTDAPFLDRITIVESPAELTFSENRMTSLQTESVAIPSLYPNPVETNSPVSVFLPGDLTDEEVNLRIFNMNGVQVFERTEVLHNGEASIDPQLTSGLYYIMIRTGSRLRMEKLIIR